MSDAHYIIKIESYGSGEGFSRCQQFDEEGCTPEEFLGKTVNEMYAVVRVDCCGSAYIVDDGYPTREEAAKDWDIKGRRDAEDDATFHITSVRRDAEGQGYVFGHPYNECFGNCAQHAEEHLEGVEADDVEAGKLYIITEDEHIDGTSVVKERTL